MNKLLEEIKKIGTLSAVLNILMSLKAKIELNRKQENRLAAHFPNSKLCILSGRAGSGKTYIMRSIFEGLNLHSKNKDDMPTAIWVEGAATSVGRRELFKENPNALYFWNEINITDLADLRLMKQLAEGLISYYKFGSVEEIKFQGLLIGTTNDFSAKGKIQKEIESLRDRTNLIDVGPPIGYDELLAIEKQKHYYKSHPASIDWHMIADSLRRETTEILTEDELDFIRPFWAYKCRECLDSRILTRSGKDFVDAFVFCKRMFGGLDDDDVRDATISFAYEVVCLSPIPMANLSVTQQDMVDALKSIEDKTISTGDMKKWLETTGRFINASTLHRNLNKLVENGFIVKVRHGNYSLLRPMQDYCETTNEFDDLLKSLY